MQFNDTVGLRINKVASLAPVVKIVRKYINASIGDIQKKIGSDKFVFSCECTDEKGLGKIIRLYNELSKAGADLEIYDGDEKSTIELIKNMKGSVTETRLSFGDLEEDEI